MVSSSSLACGSSCGVTGCEMVLMLSLLASVPTGFHCRRCWSLSLLQKRHMIGSVANDEVDHHHHGLVLGVGNAQISSRHHGAGTSPTSFPQARSPNGERRSLRRSGHVPPKVVDTPLPRPVLGVFG